MPPPRAVTDSTAGRSSPQASRKAVIPRLLRPLRAFSDPLRNPGAAARWVAALPAGDAALARRKVLDLVSRVVDPRRQIGPHQVEALLVVDAWLEPVIAELTREYTASYPKSSELELKLWQQAFDLLKAFAAAYQAALRVGYPRADDRRWRAVLPWVLVRLAFYKGQDGKFRLFRFSKWTAAQWREYHELYEFARMRGWQREQLVLGAATFSRPGVCLEEEYLQTLLLMRLDSGNFTADQVEWIARQLADWSPSLMLVPPPGDGATFFVDLTGAQGLRRLDHPHTGGRVLYLDVGPVYTRVIEQMRWLPESDEGLQPGELPVREQRLLLMRLAALFGPDTLAISPRAARHAVDHEVRVVFGLDALCCAVAETARAGAGGAGDAATPRPAPDVASAPGGYSDVLPSRVGGEAWTMADASETGCRLAARVSEAPARLGDLLAIHDGHGWSLGAVRRMQRAESDDVSLGVEILARKLVPVQLRTWTGATADGRAGAGRPFLGLYLPAHAENRHTGHRSLIGPSEELAHQGGMIEFDTGRARYLIRFTQILEQQTAWSWVLFSAVRSLAA
jgi:hypothetical protein